MKWDRIAALIAAVVIAAGYFVSVPAKAEGLLPLGKVADATGATSNWTGFYVGGGLGYQVGDTDVTAYGHGLPFAGTQISANGWAGDVRAGFDWQIAGSPIVVGVLGGYNFGEAEHNTFFMNDTIRASLEPTWYVGGRAGLAFGKSLGYVGYAYQEADASLSTSFSEGGSETVRAHVLLAGLETALAPQVTLGIEYSFAKYDDITIGDIECLGLNLDPEVHAVKARLNYRFGGK
jgi:outer membrane immunogenic protein